MNRVLHRNPIFPMSRAEMKVLNMLDVLPESYQVEFQKDLLEVPGEWPDSLPVLYRSSFTVVNDVGKRVVAHVLNDASMTWGNMIRFDDVDGRFRQSGRGFVVMVVADEVDYGLISKPRRRPEFQHLHIVDVAGPADVLNAIESEFERLMHEA